MPMKSLVNAAYDVLTKKYAEHGSEPMPFSDLLLAVGQEIGVEDEEALLKLASRFYTDLTLDGRFVIKENNTWVLREHEKFENVHIDMNEVYSIDEYEDDEATEKKSDDNEEDEDDENIAQEKVDDEKEEELGEESDDMMSTNSDEEYDENN
jgi:DNA-directed RNA polymerase subunit delta